MRLCAALCVTASAARGEAHPLAGACTSMAIAPAPGGGVATRLGTAAAGDLMRSRSRRLTGATARGWSWPLGLVRRTSARGRVGLTRVAAAVPAGRAVLAVLGCGVGSGSGSVTIGWLVAGSADGCGAPVSGGLGPAQALQRSRRTAQKLHWPITLIWPAAHRVYKQACVG